MEAEDGSFPIPKGYAFVKHLGVGPLGTTIVMRALSGRLYVCKEILKARLGKAERIQNFKARIDHIQHLKSPFFVPYTEMSEDDERILLIRNYFAEGSLAESGEKLKQFGHNKLFAMWSVLARSIYSLHKHHIAPNFLKPTNLFFYQDSCIVITDLCSPIYDDESGRAPPATDLAFMAPELFDNERSPDSLSDIWSLGILLAFMVTGAIPFETKNVFTMIQQIKEAELIYAKPVPDEINEIIRALVVVDPLKRKDLSEIIKVQSKVAEKKTLTKRKKSEERMGAKKDKKEEEFEYNGSNISIASYMIFSSADQLSNLKNHNDLIPNLRVRPISQVKFSASCVIDQSPDQKRY